MAKLTKPARDRISATKFAFPTQRKEPLENASHVHNAVARFKQVKGVTEAERRSAWKRIQSARKAISMTSANTPRCTPGMAAGAGLFDNGVFGREVESSRVAGACKRAEVPFFGTKF